jgi:ribosomal protein S1
LNKSPIVGVPAAASEYSFITEASSSESIGLDGNIDGLVHMSDISWSDVQEESIREYQKGDEVETVILAVDAER